MKADVMGTRSEESCINFDEHKKIR